MARKSHRDPVHGKLLDAWVSPRTAGQPVGCIATSYTFSPELFEEECLSRFCQLESDPQQDGIAYILEREEKMAQLQCAAALVDQHHCIGARNLRWDMLCIRPQRGILHAKVSLLVWTEVVRLIVSSANLTEDGYRRNREVFGVLDWRRGEETPSACLGEFLDYLATIVALWRPGSGLDGPAARCLALLRHTEELVAGWEAEAPRPGRRPVQVSPVLAGPGRQDALSRLGELLPSSRPPDEARVCSPFFDPPGAGNAPAQALWGRLRLRGRARVEFRVEATEDGGTGAFLLQAPQSLLSQQPPGRPVSTTVTRAVESRRSAETPSDGADTVADMLRPLHAKAMWLANDEAVVYMAGSSNFTSAGLGIGRTVNLEANLAYAVDGLRHPEARRHLEESFPPGRPFPRDAELRWQEEVQGEESAEPEYLPLPPAFGAAIYECNPSGRPRIRFIFDDTPPAGFAVLGESDGPLFLSPGDLTGDGPPWEICKAWAEKQPPMGFWVTWQDAVGRAWWPVNVASARCLPPPEELHCLPLEVLIEILTSARPMHRILAGHIARRHNCVPHDAPLVDPHKKVDTARFLLQRTRRVSWALTALRRRLQRPTPTRECLDWRLRGPVGVVAVAEALQREARSADERRFLLAELLLELHRTVPETAPNCLSAEEVGLAIQDLLGELARELATERHTRTPIDRYVADVLEAIGA